MSSILYKKGNPLDSGSRYIFHPCGVNGIGFKLIFDSYPFAKSEFEKLVLTGQTRCGILQSVKCRNITVINAIVYENGEFKFDAFVAILNEIEEMMYGKTIDIPKMFFPEKDWLAIEALIESRLISLKPIVYY